MYAKAQIGTIGCSAPPLTPGVYSTPPNKMLENRTIVLSHSLPHWNETQTKCRQAGTSNGPNALTTALKGVGRPMIEPDASEAIGGSSVAFLFLPGASCGPVQSTKISWTSACVRSGIAVAATPAVSEPIAWRSRECRKPGPGSRGGGGFPLRLEQVQHPAALRQGWLDGDDHQRASCSSTTCLAPRLCWWFCWSAFVSSWTVTMPSSPSMAVLSRWLLRA